MNVTATPLPVPVRVLVKGSSLVLMTPERRTARGAYTFPRWIQASMHEQGHLAEVWNAGVVGERTKSALRDWEEQVLAWSPDVVVFGYGYYECIHAFLPHGLERHVNSAAKRRGRVREFYRSSVLRPVWKVLAQSQRVMDGASRGRTYRRRIARVVTDYETLISGTLRVGSPLVLVLELLGPGGQAGSWFPGMELRIRRMNEAIADMVERLDEPDVRVLPVRALADALPGDPVPDGLHYNLELRKEIGRVVATEIIQWQASEPDRPPRPSDSDPVVDLLGS